MLPIKSLLKVPLQHSLACLSISRSYAISRFAPKRIPGVGRTRQILRPTGQQSKNKQVNDTEMSEPNNFTNYTIDRSSPSHKDGLSKLLLQRN
ncbi:hypothetical protein JR316_0003621 [Psilocybe cubensis]|uniref:Uncharacterized protein n=1 Tax=Psilocybe cubensis TaxID=181762 RepID=A0ACB8H8F1_PSICU|nr:hypothetical protein JR316_0003621 [Psilocybe cubensis]KAH9484141.1 hypothetical protein JR316_0003621 [Psilocybe cubensis]